MGLLTHYANVNYDYVYRGPGGLWARVLVFSNGVYGVHAWEGRKHVATAWGSVPRMSPAWMDIAHLCRIARDWCAHGVTWVAGSDGRLRLPAAGIAMRWAAWDRPPRAHRERSLVRRLR